MLSVLLFCCFAVLLFIYFLGFLAVLQANHNTRVSFILSGCTVVVQEYRAVWQTEAERRTFMANVTTLSNRVRSGCTFSAAAGPAITNSITNSIANSYIRAPFCHNGANYIKAKWRNVWILAVF